MAKISVDLESRISRDPRIQTYPAPDEDVDQAFAAATACYRQYMSPNLRKGLEVLKVGFWGNPETEPIGWEFTFVVNVPGLTPKVELVAKITSQAFYLDGEPYKALAVDFVRAGRSSKALGAYLFDCLRAGMQSRGEVLIEASEPGEPIS